MAADTTQIDRLRQDAGSPPVLIKPFPRFPEDMKQRFPSIVKLEADIERWRVETNVALGGKIGAG